MRIQGLSDPVSRELASAAARLRQAASFPELRRAMLESVTRLIPSERAYVTLLEGKTHHPGDAVFSGIAPELYAEFLERWLPTQEEERFSVQALRLKNRLTFLDRELWRVEPEQSLLYHEFLLPNGLVGGVGTYLLRAGEPIGAIACWGDGKRALSEEERERLRRLRPFLQRAALRVHLLESTLLPGDLAHRLIEKLPQPAALFGPRGELWGCSQPLLELISIDSPCYGCRATHILGSRIIEGLRQILLKSISCPEDSSGPSSLAVEKERFQVDIAALGTNPASYLVLLLDEHPAWERRLRQLTREMQFSLREQEILRQLAQGKKNAEIARAIGLSPQTVRTYMDRLRTKTKTKNRAALVSLLLER